jgi:hypothetical protein
MKPAHVVQIEKDIIEPHSTERLGVVELKGRWGCAGWVSIKGFRKLWRPWNFGRQYLQGGHASLSRAPYAGICF